MNTQYTPIQPCESLDILVFPFAMPCKVNHFVAFCNKLLCFCSDVSFVLWHKMINTLKFMYHDVQMSENSKKNIQDAKGQT